VTDHSSQIISSAWYTVRVFSSRVQRTYALYFHIWGADVLVGAVRNMMKLLYDFMTSTNHASSLYSILWRVKITHLHFIRFYDEYKSSSFTLYDFMTSKKSLSFSLQNFLHPYAASFLRCPNVPPITLFPVALNLSKFFAYSARPSFTSKATGKTKGSVGQFWCLFFFR
jgi:hypothetical protein